MNPFFIALTHAGFTGNILTDYATRLVNATDNSIYQYLPEAVVQPRSEGDIQLLAELIGRPEFRHVHLTPRGGGTGTNGQSLNDGIIVDMSRHLRKIIAFDEAARTVTVEPGVILEELNAFLKSHGLFFPPTVSPGNRATLGGMVATDACGKGSRIYGKTSDYIIEMEAVLPGGASIHDVALAPNIHSAMEGFTPPPTKLPRGISGYNLKEAASIHKLIAGSEGTLALIKRITFRLLPLPKHKALAVLSYADFMQALEAVPALLALNPLAVEALDEKVLKLAEGDFLWHEVAKLLPVSDDTGAVHFVEFVAESEEDLNARLAALTAHLNHESTAISHRVVSGAEQIASLWNIRKRCVGLLGNVEGNRRPIPFIEDTAVPPEHLPAYIRELRTFLSSHNIDAGMFGHVDAGCLHVRPALDLRQEQDQKLIRTLTDGVAALVQKYEGVIWGEHGKGMRGEYIEQLLGADYAACMQRVKAVFDPYNQLNPGKLVLAKRIDEVPLRGTFDRQISAEMNTLFPKATQCNGNGACFNYELNDAMCPSYKATGDRIHSPKGRAALLREWMRLESTRDTAAAEEVAALTYTALDGCLSCNACTAQCPIKVNIPEMKSRFLFHFHKSRRRPLKDYVLASLETLAPIGARWPRLFNALLPLVECFGLRDLPAFSIPTLEKYAAGKNIRTASRRTLPSATAKSVILVQDAFTSFFDAPAAITVIEALERLGYEVLLAPFMASGKPLHIKGFRDAFARTAKANTEHLAALAAFNVPLVGIDPSITLAYRQEYAGAPKVFTLDEFLAANLPLIPPARPGHFRLFTHCTEKTAMPESPARWKKILEQAGHRVEIITTGCCGMAGAYGHEAAHLSTSAALYDASWRRPVEAAGEVAVVTGFSCRSQIKRQSGRNVLHPLAALLHT